MDSATRPPPPYRPLPSAHSTIAWPALPGPQAALKAALLQQLEQSQWWSAARLRGAQFRQAGALLDHAYRQVPFYRDRLAQAGFVPGQPLTEEVWARIPVLTRADLQAAGAALVSEKIPEGHGSTYEISSSGSTGQVVTVRGSAIMQMFWHALTLREHLWHSRDLSARLAAIRPFEPGVADYPQGAANDQWGQSMQGLWRSGPSFLLNIACSAEQQAEWLLRVKPNYLLTYPSALRDLLLYCRERGIKIPGLYQVRTLSETLPPETRALCRAVWGLEIADMYSTQEAGYLAIQCAEEGSYHVQSEAVLVEVLDETGASCEPGEIGQVVITSLMNFAMPLIRYAVGDMAEAGTPCPCGRGLPVLARILGRVRNTLHYPDGRRGWPMMGDIYHAGVDGIRQYQLVQHGLDDIELILATVAPLSAADEDSLRQWLHQRSGHPFALRFSYVTEIQRGPSGKFETFRSEVTA